MQIPDGLSSYVLWRVHEPKPGKIGTFDKNRDPLGTQIVEKVPLGTFRDPGP